MSMGVGTQSRDRVINMYSPNMGASFYRGNATITYSGSIQNSEFGNTFAIATPIDPASIYSNVNYITEISCTGYIPSGGLTYNQPSYINTSDSEPSKIGGGLIAPSVSAQPAYVHYFGTPISRSNNYGLVAPGAAGSSLAIDNQYKSLYIQPKASDGLFIRSGTASSLPSNTQSSKSPAAISFTQPAPQNIYFDKAYINPPLVFITASSGPIAMNYMIRDGDGKYVGASIVATSGLTTIDNTRGTGFYAGNTYSFSYFLISEEPPSYAVASDSWGMRVFNDRGTEVFSSSHFVPSLMLGRAPTPFNTLHSSGYFSYNSGGFNFSGAIGVCINNFHSVTGYSAYNSYNVSMGYYLWQFGPMNITGKYIHVTEGSNVLIFGGGSLAVARATSGGIFPGKTISAEFAGDTSGNVDVLFATYSY